MSRNYCPKCHYPRGAYHQDGYPQGGGRSACVCAHIRPFHARTELIVLQHPSEVGHAKNSVRLLQLVLPDTRVVVGETEADFVILRQQLEQAGRPVYLLYPCETSVSATGAAIDTDCILLLLDGTWRKALKLLRLNPWLKQFPALHLDLDQASGYRIRKASRSDSLSTLEAAAQMLKTLDASLDVSPLFEALDAMVSQRIAAMPAEVRRRYYGSD